MHNYKYKILNYWDDLNDLYVNYIIEDKDVNNKANVIYNYNIFDINCNYHDSAPEKIHNELLKLIKENNGMEFNLPRVSEISSLLKYIYDFVCESEYNMCHIDESDWKELKEENNFSDDDIVYLKEEIKKYNLGDYITIDEDGYKICGYGGLQCCFNDDIEKGNIELER